MTEICTKESKGWWNEDFKMAHDELKNYLRKYNKRQTSENHNDYLSNEQCFQNIIKTFKFDLYKKTSEYLNLSKDANHFWYKYEKILKTKKDVTEPLYNVSSKKYVFKDEIISNILHNHHINNDKTSNYDGHFKKQIL